MKSPTTPLKESTRLLYIVTITLAFTMFTVMLLLTRQKQQPDLEQLLSTRMEELKQITQHNIPKIPSINVPPNYQPRLIFYNRPPKTGSTTVRIAMKRALDAVGLKAAHCFNMIEWNEMGLKTIVNRRNVDFYGCHTRLTNARYMHITQMRGGNVTFITNTRNPENIILSAYLQFNRNRQIASITDEQEIQKEIERYKKYVDNYPVDALYHYHGADVPLTKCPVEWPHIDAMRRVAERYEVVIDLKRPHESAVMVEAVTGLRPDFTPHFNERTTDTSGKMLTALKNIDTSHKTCGNELVHKVMMQQFNIIKDRLMQNRCFTEETASFELCEKAVLKKEEIKERTRAESYKLREALSGR